MVSPSEFSLYPLKDKIKTLFTEGTFIVAIRYYGYKVNLYLLNDFYVEVFYNHKLDLIEKVELFETSNSRLKFYTDQISLPGSLFE